ncbi:TRAP transporter large permease [Euzebya tangerina]|uniref:TRAP transporter large permease n=1 Tax=Euzebya tangerina TaxID=591198 RepID=UPI000E318DF7|nr:TRAP transporter large permease subunit [Euzebya tangerina]
MDLGVILAFVMFGVFLALLLIGYNVAYCFAGTAVMFTFIGDLAGVFDPSSLALLPSRWFPTLSNQTLLAIPFFVLMGAVLEQSGVAERLLRSIGLVMGNLRGGVAIAVIIVGTLLAAATGVVAATVIVMGLLSLPTMVKYGYDHKLATGAIVASGTLAQLLPPSLVLILLAQQMNISVLGLFRGALLPGLLMAGLYIAYVAVVAWRRPDAAPAMPQEERDKVAGIHIGREVLVAMVPPVLLIAAVLYAIFGGIATPSESGAVGALGALVLATANRKLSWEMMRKSLRSTADIVILVMTLLFASTFFAQVFERLGGQDQATRWLSSIGGGKWGFVVVAMIAVFLLGINLEFLEITFIVVPIFVPAMLALNFTEADFIWFTVLMAINLNMAFISPPVGFSLFYLQGVKPDEVRTASIHRGALPFMGLQIVALVLVAAFPAIVTVLL